MLSQTTVCTYCSFCTAVYSAGERRGCEGGANTLCIHRTTATTAEVFSVPHIISYTLYINSTCSSSLKLTPGSSVAVPYPFLGHQQPSHNLELLLISTGILRSLLNRWWRVHRYHPLYTQPFPQLLWYIHQLSILHVYGCVM